MPHSCVMSMPGTSASLMAAAALAFGASPALANGAAPDSDASNAASSQQALSNLIPVTSWDDERSVADEHGDAVLARLSGGGSGSVARRRPGMVSSPAPVRAASNAAGAKPGFSAGARFTSRMPVASRAVTSGFGLRRHPLLGDLRVHAGVDLAAPAGSPVAATADGTVSAAGWSGGYGLLVAVEHGGGRETRYAHLSRLNVAAGQRVRQGDVIGFVGSTGRSTGPHLHYETRVNGRAINPLRR